MLRLFCFALLLAAALAVSPFVSADAAEDDGIVKFKSAYAMPETIKRLKKDVADKGIMFFDEIDQAKLAADAGVTLLPLDTARLRQPAARHFVPHLGP